MNSHDHLLVEMVDLIKNVQTKGKKKSKRKIDNQMISGIISKYHQFSLSKSSDIGDDDNQDQERVINDIIQLDTSDKHEISKESKEFVAGFEQFLQKLDLSVDPEIITLAIDYYVEESLPVIFQEAEQPEEPEESKEQLKSIKIARLSEKSSAENSKINDQSPLDKSSKILSSSHIFNVQYREQSTNVKMSSKTKQQSKTIIFL